MIDYSRPTLDMYAALANIGMEYSYGRLSREQFIEAAVVLGLTRNEAHRRAEAWDQHPFPALAT